MDIAKILLTSIPFIIIALCFLLVPWFTHISMCKGVKDCNAIGYSNFNSFIREFNKIKWSYEDNYEKSLFSREENSEIHASIFKFNSKVMIMRNPFDFYRAEKYVKQYIKGNFKHKFKINKNYKWE